MGWFTNFVPTVGWGVYSGIGASGLTLQPIIIVAASNGIGGDDQPTAVLTAEDAPAGVVAWDINNGDTGAIAPIDINGVGIPRAGGYQTNASTPASTTPAINFAKAIADANGVTTVLIPVAAGGRGVFFGGDTDGIGPFAPGSTGAAWDPNDIASTSPDVSNSLYRALSDDTGNGKSLVQNAWEAALAASEYASYTVLDPIFFGYPANENDTGADYDVLVDRSIECITDIRERWGTPDAPWVMTMGPPEWIYSGPLNRAQIAAANFEVANRLSNIAYVEGITGYQHATEAIHYNNAGYRLLGTKAAAAVITATGRPAQLRGVDWIDALTVQPSRYYSLQRGLSTYTGFAIEIDNGTSTADISFTTDGYLDHSAIMAHAGTGDAWITKVYDQMGSGETMVPDASNTADPLIVSSGVMVTQGNRVAWGDNGNTMLADTSVTVGTSDALMYTGMIADAGNAVAIAGAQNTAVIGANGGNVLYEIDNGTEQEYTPTYEPSWAGGGYGLFSYYLDSAGLYDGADLIPSTPRVSFSYGSSALAWSGRVGQTNRYGRGNNVTAAWWSTPPTGDDKTAVLAATAAIGQRGDIEVT